MPTSEDVRTVLIDGHYWYVGPNGWRHPAVMGGEGPTDNKGGGGDPTNTPGGHVITREPAADTVTKAEADRIAAQARKEAAKEAEKALLAQFGENASVDAIKAMLDKQRADEDARKDDLTKATEAAQKREQAAVERERKAAAKERTANVRAALLAAGVKSDRLAKAERIVEVSEDADEDAITAAVEAVKKDTPEWFPAPGVPAPSGLPGTGQPPVGNNGLSGIEAGRARARREREAQAKKPAFGEGLTFIGGQAS